jgi:hypothetical protein
MPARSSEVVAAQRPTLAPLDQDHATYLFAHDPQHSRCLLSGAITSSERVLEADGDQAAS